MISGSLLVPFQKGPCGEGGRMRGFLLPLLEEASVVVLVLLLIFLNFPLFSQHQSKQNNLKKVKKEEARREESEALAFGGRRSEW